MYLETSKLLILSLVIVTLLLASCESGLNLPRAGQPPTKPLPRSMKGYELYSWQVGQEWYFTLITATNRTKTYQEIAQSENTVGDEWVHIMVQGVHDIEVALTKLPPDTYIVWTGPQTLRKRAVRPGGLALPPRRTIEDIKAQCQDLGVRLEVSR